MPLDQQSLYRKHPVGSHSHLGRSLGPATRRRWPLVVGGLVLAGLKAQALAMGESSLFRHPSRAVVVLPVLAALALLRAKPIAMALLLAPVAAVVIDPRSILVGVAIAVAAFVVLVCVCVGIGTVLGLRDRHSSRR